MLHVRKHFVCSVVAYRAALISVPLALSQIPVYTARPQRRGLCAYPRKNGQAELTWYLNETIVKLNWKLSMEISVGQIRRSRRRWRVTRWYVCMRHRCFSDWAQPATEISWRMSCNAVQLLANIGECCPAACPTQGRRYPGSKFPYTRWALYRRSINTCM